MKNKTNKKAKAKNKTEVKRVLIRNTDKQKFVIVPRNSIIEAGDYVSIKKLELENATAN